LIDPNEKMPLPQELHALARLMIVEYEAETVGRQGVRARLAEAMFVLVLRHHMTKRFLA
jgi:hypothetical protein